ncbi:MAG: ATP-binding cassette domain-containing protein [Ruminococcaceae bacterium]|nr:ATP-binding cassette domain-containing protein [Oscillospiraceae bacterium]
MIKLSNVSKVYPNGTKALSDVSVTIPDGDFVFIIGPNGAGKTTLTKLLLGEEKPTTGKIEVNGYDLGKIKKRKIPYFRRTLGFVFQDHRLFPNMTVFDNVAFAMHVIGEPNKLIKQRVWRFLKYVNLENQAYHYPNQLSGGEQRRVALARALVNNPSIVIADEPTSNSDPIMSVEMMELLKKVNDVGKTVIVISHDIKMVKYYNKRVLTLNDGYLADDHKKAGDEDEV